MKKIAGAVVVVVGVSLLVATPTEAKPPRPERLTSQAEQLDDDGYEVRGRAWTQKGQPKVVTPAPVWPKAGKARATVSAARATARAGNLPVSVQRTAGSSVAAVDVEVLDRATVPAAWRDGLVLKVSSPRAGAASVAVDYSGFRHAYGAGWAERLRLWEVPACALSTPQLANCGAKPLPSRNTPSAGTVTAQVPVATGNGTVVALAAAASGESGDFAATSLSASSTWTSGGSSGDFSWSYPLRVPPSLGGPQPNISLAYSSSSVDGRSEATNNQPSWLGEGFEFWPGYIERRYVPCSEDMAGSANNNTKTGDLCWRSDNATMSLNGGGSELIWESGKGWHSRSEDGAKIEKLTGASNSDNNGEYWKVTTSDGTQYFFGLDDLPGQSAATDSAWRAQVYGNHDGEPCHATAFADSDCAQVWRWNLDYVIDPRGNTMSYWYGKEFNQYAARLTDAANQDYVRGGFLKRIDYGTWDRGASDRSVTPTARVTFDTADRCLSSCGTHTSTYWPDVPWDQNCATDATECPGLYSPTFWTTKRLSKITASVWDTTKATPAWQNVESWTLTHSFPSPGDGTNAGLWLSSIVRQGLVGTTVTMPPVTFEPVSMPNRVLTRTNTTNNWQRIANIVTETGAKIQVSYSLPECTSSNLPSAAHTNTMRCYPVIGPDPHSSDENALLTEWWHKYVVRQVSETDIQLAGGHQAPTKNTYYSYGGSPAWHYADDDGFTKPKYKTWNQFRGYSTVSVRVGDDPALQTLTKTTYLRGMHADRLAPSGGTRTVTVGASLGSETVYDEDVFAGMVREQVVYNGVESKPVSKTVNVPWQSPPTASRTINGDQVTARFTNTQTTYASTVLGVDGQDDWQTTRSKSTFDNTYGTVTTQQHDGNIDVVGDEKCVSTTYNRNTAKNIITLPKRITTTALPCGSNPATTDDVITDVRNTYDGASSPDTAPVYGGVTKVEQLKSWTAIGGTVFQTTSQSTLDAFGRALTSTDIRGNTTTTAYTPASGGPVTKTTVTNEVGWVTSTDMAVYWGVAAKTTDPNGRVSEATYDALGRVLKVWDVGWSREDHPDTPSTEYTYGYSAARSDYPYVKTRTLNAAGGYLTSYQIFDGFLRERQTQVEAVGGGRVVADVIQDAWGRVAAKYQAHAEPDGPSGTLWWEPEWSVPALVKTVYDRANRATNEIYLAGDGVTNLVEKRRTTTAYAGDRTMVTPPAGGTPTTTVTDVEGRTVELWQHTTSSGVTGAHTTTKYTYDQRGQLRKVVDTYGNEWSYAYDVKGRQIEARDPDKGLTKSDYNDYNDLTKTTDARGEVLAYQYDDFGRKVGLYDDEVTPAKQRAKWVYDTLAGGGTVRGQLTQTIRYDGGNQYISAVSNFDERYQPTGMVYVIPSTETGLAGSYTIGYGYSAYDGSSTSITYPLAGGLGAEQVTTVYNAATGLPTQLNTNMTGVSSYVAGQQYTSYGEPTVATLKTAGGVYVEEANYYDTYTRRLARTTVKPETATGTVSDRNYSYDPAGNILSIADTPQVGQVDTQCFRYDELRRLRKAWTPKSGVTCATDPAVASLGGPAPYFLEWDIDDIGNRKTEVSRTAAGDTTRTYTVPTSGAGVVRPHAVTSVTTEVTSQAATTQSYGYDNAGNMAVRPGQTVTWDAEGRMRSVIQGNVTTTNVYDVDGNRLIRRDATGKTLYLPGMELRYDTASASQSTTRYYGFGGKTVGSRSTAGGLVWLFADHQGTQQLTVNPATQAVTTRRQTPYGGTRGTLASWPNQKGFVGGDNDPTGLVHIGAREYDTALGRFISVDPLQDLTDPQQWNGYSYADNTPVTSSDPTGMIPADCMEFDCYGYDPNNGCPHGCGTPDNIDWGTRNNKSSTRARKYNHPNRLGRVITIPPWVDRDKFVRAWYEDLKKEYGNFGPFYNDAEAAHHEYAYAMYVCGQIGRSECGEWYGELYDGFIATLGDLPMDERSLGAGVTLGPKGLVVKVPTVPGSGSRGGRPGGGRPSCRSFSGETEVLMADGSTKPIEDIEIGDEVLATDPETGEQGARTVTHVWVHDDEVINLNIDGKVLVTTEDHPFWNHTDREWQRADELGRDDWLLSFDGKLHQVDGIRPRAAYKTVAYNLAVDGIHSYYVVVGDASILVHNDDLPGVIRQGIDDIKNGRPQRLRPDGTPDFFEARKGTPLGVARKWGGARIYDVEGGGNRYRILVNQYGDVGWVDDHNYSRIRQTSEKIQIAQPRQNGQDFC